MRGSRDKSEMCARWPRTLRVSIYACRYMYIYVSVVVTITIIVLALVTCEYSDDKL